MNDPETLDAATPPLNDTEPRRVAAVTLFYAAKELYVASTLLRMRIMQVKAIMTDFSEWGRHTEAMRKMEKMLREAENTEPCRTP